MKYINFLILVLLMSCGENASEKKSRIEKEEFLKRKEQEVLAKSELIKYYNPVVDWDTAKVFTYWYQENICGDQLKIAFEGKLKDITKIDSVSYAIKLYKEINWSSHVNDRVFLAECRITNQQKVIIEKSIEQTKGLFIIKIEKIEAHFPEIKPETDSGEYGDEYYLNYDFEKKLIIFRGYLIDFRLYEN